MKRIITAESEINWTLQTDGKPKYGFTRTNPRIFVHPTAIWLGWKDSRGRIVHTIPEKLYEIEALEGPRGFAAIRAIPEWRLEEWETRKKLQEEGVEAVREIAKMLTGGESPWDDKYIEFISRVDAVVNVYEYYTGLSTGRFGIRRGEYGTSPEQLEKLGINLDSVFLVSTTKDMGHTRLKYVFEEDLKQLPVEIRVKPVDEEDKYYALGLTRRAYVYDHRVWK